MGTNTESGGESGTARSAAPAIPRLPALALLTPLFLGVAIWNRFPLVFYDTGAYMAEGLNGAFFVERSPVYSLLLPATGAFASLWLTVAVQSLLTAFIIVELARVEVPRLSLGRFLAIAIALMGLTGIGWYVGQVEPDCFTPLVVLGGYLLLFRSTELPRWSRNLTVAVTALSVASHPSHLGLVGGLLICAVLMRLFRRRVPHLPIPRLLPCLSALLFSLAMVVAANYAFTRTVFVSRAGSVFLLARLMQDGIVQRLMTDACPAPGSAEPAPYTLCAWQPRIPRNANAWLWGEHSPFRVLGGFQRSDGEYGRIARDSVRRYPWMHAKAAVTDSALQFLEFKTGDGIESQAAILRPAFERTLPRQLAAYEGARQQTERIAFKTLNLLHVPVAVLSLLSLLLFLHHAAVRGRWDELALPATVLLALLGNAVICGTFSNPHDRYQSRLIWMPTLVLMLVRARDPRALQPVPESGT